MIQFNLYVHGVPIGHEVCPRDGEEDYLKNFYSHDKDIKETSFMQIDFLNGKSFYTYLHKKNVSSEIGRPGSYLGLTVSFTKQYCTNVYMLYEILDTIYHKICVGCLVRQESVNERFLVKEIASAQFKGNLAVDYMKAVFKQNMDKYLSNDFEDVDGFVKSVGEARFSLKEVDSPLFREALRNKTIFVSPEYGTMSLAYSNLLKEVDPLKEGYERIKQENAQLKEKNSGLISSNASLEEELSKTNASVKKEYQKKLDEIQTRYDEIKTKYNEIKEEKKQLEENFQKVVNAVEVMEEPLKVFSRLTTSYSSERISAQKNTKSHVSWWEKESVKSRIPMVSCILLLCLLIISVYGFFLSSSHESDPIVQGEEFVVKANVYDSYHDASQKVIEDVSSEKEEVDTEATSTYDDFSLCKIDISQYNGRDMISKGREYSLSVVTSEGKAANVPKGQWESTTGGALPGIVIYNDNKFKVNETVWKETNVQIFYTINGEHVLSRTITVK